MDFMFAELKDCLDGRFIQQEQLLLSKMEVMIDQKMDQKLDQRFDEFEGRMIVEFGKLRSEMHVGFVAVADTISRTNDFHDSRYANHERRIVQLERKTV